MGLFNFSRKKRVTIQGFAAQKAVELTSLQAFALEPILTPSGLVDAPDHTPDVMDWVTHPGADAQLFGDSAHFSDYNHTVTSLDHPTDASSTHNTATDSSTVMTGGGYGSAQDLASHPEVNSSGDAVSAVNATTNSGHQIEPIAFHDTAPNDMGVAGSEGSSTQNTSVPHAGAVDSSNLANTNNVSSTAAHPVNPIAFQDTSHDSHSMTGGGYGTSSVVHPETQTDELITPPASVETHVVPPVVVETHTSPPMTAAIAVTQVTDGHPSVIEASSNALNSETPSVVHPAEVLTETLLADSTSAHVPDPIVLPAHQPLIGVIDTGFNAHNPYLDYSHIQLGHDYVENDNNPLIELGQGNDHGTKILGLIAAHSQPQLGLEGINDQAPLWLGRAVGSGHWADSLTEFVNVAKASGQTHAVVNLSFDLTQLQPDGSLITRHELTSQEWAAIDYAHQNGVLIVAAAGNTGGAMSALGQASQLFDNIITVGAATGRERASYSSYGQGLDLLAPGGSADQPLLSTSGEGVGTINGSSAAAAEVTGAVSLIWAANPGLNHRQVIDLLKATATDLATPGWDGETGAGLLNLAAAVQLAKATAPEPYNLTDWFTQPSWSGDGSTPILPLERDTAETIYLPPPPPGPPPPPPPGPTPSDPPPSDPPPPPTITYLDSLQRVLGKVGGKLQGQLPGLLATGKLVDDNHWYDFMSTVAYGVYASAQNARTPKTAEALGRQLLQQVQQAQTPAIVEFYPAKLLVAAKLAQVPKLQQSLEDPQFVEDLTGLGRAYASLQPKGVQTASERSFFSQLWQAQDESDLRQGATKLEEALQEVSDPARAVRFMSALLKAVKQVPALSQQVHDTKFLDEVVQLGLEYAKSQPLGADSNGNSLNFFLDTLWQASDASNGTGYAADQFLTYYIQKGAGELGAFLNGFNSNDQRLKLFQLEGNLIKTGRLSSNLQGQEQNTQFWAELMRLGRAYALENPTAPFGTGDQPTNFFLDTLWQSPSPDRDVVDKSVTELTTFLFQLDDPEQRAKFLEFESRLLELLEQIPTLKQVALKDPKFIKAVLGAGQLYAALKFSPTSPPGPQAGGSFLDLLWQGQPIQGEPLQQAQKFFKEMGPAAVNQEAVTFGLRLLIANERRAVVSEATDAEGNLVTTASPDLTVQMAQLARAYAELDPEKQPDYHDFFLNTLWSTSNAATTGTLEQIDLGAQELQAFLVGSDPTKPTFASADQPKVLEFEAKLLKAAKMTPDNILGARQKQDPDILKKLFVDLGRNSAQFHLKGAGNDTFLDTLWNAPIRDNGAIKKGVKALEQYLDTNGITIRSLEYINKVLLALNRLPGEFQKDGIKLLEEIHQNLGAILGIAGVVAAGLAFPPTTLVTLLLVTGFDIYYTVVFGQESVKGFFEFFAEIGQAQSETDIDEASQKLAHALETGVLSIAGLLGFFKSFATVAAEGQKVIKAGQELIKLIKTGLTEVPSVLKFFTQFGRNEKVLAFIANAVQNVGKGGIQKLWAFIVHLGQREEVFNLLAKLSDQKDDRLLDDVLKIGTKAIDDLDVILKKGATAEQIVKLRFDVPGMSLTKLKQLLERIEMTPSILADLFFKRPGMSIPLLERLLNIPKMSPSLLLRLLEKEGMSIDSLQALLAKCKDPELLAGLLDKVPSVADLQALLAKCKDPELLAELLGKPGITLTILLQLLSKASATELQMLLNTPGMTVASLSGLLQGATTNGKGLSATSLQEAIRKGFSIQEIQHIKQLAEDRFREILTVGSPFYQATNKRGPVLTVIVDSKTGQTFYGENTGIPNPLHPLLQKRLDEYNLKMGGLFPPGKGIPGVHSEINALNAALYARGNVTESDLQEFISYNIRLKGSAKGDSIPRCINCNYLTDGIESLGD